MRSSTLASATELAAPASRPPAARGAAAARRFLRRDPIAGLCALYLAAVVLLAVFAPALTPFTYDKQDLDATLRPPFGSHWLGTDNLGRDVFTRVAYGARISLTVAAIAVAAEITVGSLWGTIAGLLGGAADAWMMRVVDLLIAFPSLLLAILITGVFGPSLVTIVAALVTTSWPAMARVVRSEVVALREREFVEAARALGARTPRVVGRHLLPNVFHLVAARSTLDVSAIILAEASLSFVGVGVQPPMPSWGLMINEAFQYLRSQPALLAVPALFLSLTVISLNVLGEALADALDPHRRR
jgi:ABC-type dipeptide/oligopeptide/nickel transport system permease subunit